MKLLLCSLTVLTLLPATGRAAIIITGDVSTHWAPCTLTLTSDFTLVIPDARSFGRVFLVLEDWVVSDDKTSFADLSPGLRISINGSFDSPNTTTLFDNHTPTYGNYGAISGNDGYFEIILGPTPAGTTLTFPAGVYSFSGVEGMNPQIAQTFVGEMFLTDDGGNVISNTVPEASAPLLFGMAGSLCFLRRRRSA